MMHLYTDIDQFANQLSMVDDSDSPTATNFNTPTEGLADRTRYLLSQSGAFAFWVTGADADTTYTRQRRRTVIRISAAALSDHRIYTLGNTSATTGDLFEIINDSTLKLITVKNAAATILAILGPTQLNGADSTTIQAGGQHGVFIFNGSSWELLYTSQTSLQVLEFTGSGSWVVPANYTGVALAIGCGGGGGGGGGAGQDTTTNNYATGGGGGAAGILATIPVSVIAGETLTIDVGSGGAPGGGGNSGFGGSIGGDGGHTTISRGGTILGRFKGGRGGMGGIRLTGSADLVVVLGGSRGDFAYPASGVVGFDRQGFPGGGAAGFNIALSPGDGGPGGPNFIYLRGGRGGAQDHGCIGGGFVPGTGGLHGTNDSTSRGGGGGGGGGEGPFQTGGDGGTGGNGLAAGPPGGGVAGSAASANSGAGGGGGGGGGAGTGGAVGGTGGTGGSGRLYIIIPR